jgi:hypothetical protein
MSGLEYWFDERKITGADENAKKTAVKQKFQEMMLQNETLTQRGTEVFNAIWGNANLRESLFPRPQQMTDDNLYRQFAFQSFMQKVINMDETLFGFIKVK